MAKKSVYLISFYTENTLIYNNARFFLLNFNSYSCPNKQVPFTTYSVHFVHAFTFNTCTQCFKNPIFRLMHVKLSKE